ncbi:DUF6242 domain-containing protein, partial [Silvanigrella paludirubra]|uniref:DUF6242 domain-containing protein n=1 Tax=Silvanigrella paludirubra TaxID=2499159 RepID=UPI00192A4123
MKRIKILIALSFQLFILVVSCFPIIPEPKPPLQHPNINEFSIPSQISSSISGNNVNVVMPFGTNLTSLVATFSLSAGASAKINGTTQVSTTTANDFTNPVTYTITAQDGVSNNSYTVTVTNASNSAAQLTAFSIPSQISSSISGNNVNVVMPFGTNLTSLVATFSLSAGASAK